MELFKTNLKTKMVMAAVINGETKFLRFAGNQDPYASNIQYANKYGNNPDYSIISTEFSFEDQENCTLFTDLTFLIEVVQFDVNHKHNLAKLLKDNNLKREEVVIQNIKGTEVSISPLSLDTLFSHMEL